MSNVFGELCDRHKPHLRTLLLNILRDYRFPSDQLKTVRLSNACDRVKTTAALTKVRFHLKWWNDVHVKWCSQKNVWTLKPISFDEFHFNVVYLYEHARDGRTLLQKKAFTVSIEWPRECAVKSSRFWWPQSFQVEIRVIKYVLDIGIIDKAGSGLKVNADNRITLFLCFFKNHL